MEKTIHPGKCTCMYWGPIVGQFTLDCNPRQSHVNNYTLEKHAMFQPELGFIRCVSTVTDNMRLSLLSVYSTSLFYNVPYMNNIHVCTEYSV